MSKPSPTTQAMLTAAGFATEDDLYDTYAIEAKEAGDAGARAMQLLINAFTDLESAERRLHRALDSFAVFTADAQNALKGVDRKGQPLQSGPMTPNTGCLTSAARDAAQANADMQAAVERIKTLAWVRGTTAGE